MTHANQKQKKRISYSVFRKNEPRSTDYGLRTTHYALRLAFRSLAQQKLRTFLSALAVALGAALIVAADVISGAILAVFSSPDLQTVGAGLFGQLKPMLTFLGGAVAAAAGFLVFNAFLMAVTQRRREFGALRAIGMTRRQVLSLVLFEAALVGGAGTLAGLLVGPLLGRGALYVLKAVGGPMFSAFGEQTVSPWAVLLAASVSLGVALLAALLPAWQATRVAPLEALRESESANQQTGKSKNHSHSAFHVLRTVLGVIILVALIFWFVPAPPGAWVQPPVDVYLTGAVLALWLLGWMLLLPDLIGAAARAARGPLTRLWGATGRLIADNLARGRLRVTLTVATLALGLTLIAGMSGFITFTFDELFRPTFQRTFDQEMFVVATFDPGEGVAGYANMKSLSLPAGLVETLRAVSGNRARVTAWRFTLAPELEFLLKDYFSFVFSPAEAWQNQGWVFRFTAGDWEQAQRWSEESPCLVLIAPLVAHNNAVALGDTFTVHAPGGEVLCRVAGVGQPYVNASIIIAHDLTPFAVGEPFALVVAPAPGVNRAALLADVQAATARYGELHIFDLNANADMILKVTGSLDDTFNAFLLLAIVAAALGVVNTTLMSVNERAREFALLRSLGATRRQVQALVVGEAALMGVLGGGLGLVIGVGIAVILPLTYGGNGFGLPDLNLWSAAAHTAHPALLNGLVGLLAAPLICAAAAYSVVRSSYSVFRKDALRPTQYGLRNTKYEIRLALHNLRARAARTLLSAFAVALGVAMLVATSVFRSGIEAAWTAGANKFAFITEVSNLTFGGVGLMMLSAAGFLIYNAFAMSVTQQQRQIGLLRAVGMTREQVLRLVLVEALFTGGLGTALGVLGGPLVGNGILSAMAYFGVETGRGRVAPGSVALALVMGLGISLLSALIPARRAARLSPLEALREGESADQRVSESARKRESEQADQRGSESAKKRESEQADQRGSESAKRLRFTFHVSRLMLGLILLLPLWVYLIIAPPGVWTGYHQPWDYVLSAILLFVWWIGFVLATPALLGGVVRGLRVLMRRLSGGMGRLLGDNLGRAPERLSLTALTFAVGLMMMVSTGGFVSFGNEVMVGRIAAQALREQAWYIYPFNRVEGLGQLRGFQADAPALEPAIIAEVERLAAGRATVEPLYMVAVPEISSPFPGFPSLVVLEPEMLTRPSRFHMVEGDWDTALPLLRAGCGLLVSPAIAARYGAGVGDPITVTGRAGPVTCIVAATGAGGFAPMSFIGPGGFDLFIAPGASPDSLQVRPLAEAADAEIAALDADLRALPARYGADRVYISRPEDELKSITGTSDQLMQIMNGLLFLAVGAGALGSVNTTLVSLLERQRELALLRALGATRRQLTGLIVGESAITGLLGALLGMLAGWGTIAIYALTYGGVTFGLVDLPLWTAVAEVTWPALRGGLPGLVAAPVLAAIAAFFVVRSSYSVFRKDGQGSTQYGIRTTQYAIRMGLRERFVLGAAALLFFLMAGLVAAVVGHQERYMDDSARQLAGLMAQSQVQLLELELPDDATTLSLSALGGQIDAERLLSLQSLLADVGDIGLTAYTIADRDNVVLLSLNPREIGALAPPLENVTEAFAWSEREDEAWRIHATAPVRNAAGDVIGAVWMTFDMAWVQAALRELRGTLWAVGGGVSLAALILAWLLATPLVRATQQLAAHAAGVARGEYVPFARPRQRPLWEWITARTSLRARLTIALTCTLLLLVGSLEVVTLPIQRRHVEKTLLDGSTATLEWLGEMMSEALGQEALAPGDLGTDFSLDHLLTTAGTLDWSRLQALSEQNRPAALAYIALVGVDGGVRFSDQLALVGEQVGVSAVTETTARRWRNEEVWVVSTPLMRGRGGERVGVLQMALRRAEVEAFLDESRLFFRLAGLSAVLAGMLLAQVIGGAVAGPVRTLAAGTRRIAAGDLAVHFDVRGQDEVAQLAAAYNAMVAGLREREWLRDMFGRFVSQEVAEALRTGQVRLEGENRVVSVLFCDIRGFTARSERHTPQEIVALLNEYLPVVVEAAQHHQGTVNKFGGDSTLVIYGAPRPLQESAYQAVLTALEMRANLAQLNTRLAARGEEPIRIGVGINTGVVLAGAVGPHERQEYTVIGDTVNLASRIEALNKEYPEHGILISGATYEALGQHRAEFVFADLGELGIRGKSAPVHVWAVMATAPTAPVPQRPGQ